jgi:competence protein ComFC
MAMLDGFRPLLPSLRRCSEAVMGLLYPPHCAACRAETPPGVHLCKSCTAAAWRITAPFCERCSQPFDGAATAPFTCSNCGDRQFHFQCCVSPYRARGVVRDLVHRFKYGKEFHLRWPLADLAATAFDDDRLLGVNIDALVPVPLHPTRQREREFTQAEAIAELLARRTGIPLCKAIRRIRYTTTQTQLDREERRENLRDAFSVREPAPVQGRHLIIVDDVFTTGSTVEECARILHRAGAASIRAVTIARG